MGNRIKDHALLNFFTLKPYVESVKEKLIVMLWEKVKADSSMEWNYNYIFTDPLSWLVVESYHDVSFVEIALGEIFDLVDHDLHSLLVSAVVLPVLDNKYIEYF